jgi:hypothetical protein
LESLANPAMVILGLAAVQKKGFPLRKKQLNKTMLANGVYMVFLDQYLQAKGYNSIDMKGKTTDN